MYVERIRLVGYKRFSVSGKQSVDVRFTQPRHAILGTNGSGKSSLLQECNAFPAIKSKYKTGGSKEVWFKHQGTRYYSLSSFEEDTPSYTLHDMDNDIALVNQGNQTTYKKVLYDLLKWNEKHKALLYETPIAELPPSARKNTFSLLNGDDVEKGLSLYFKLVKQNKDIKAQLAYINQRYEATKDRQITDEQYQSYLTELQRIRLEGDKLDLLRTPTTLSKGQIEDLLNSKDIQLTNLNSVLIEQDNKLNSKLKEIDLDLNDLDIEYNKITNLIIQLESESKYIAKDLDELEKNKYQIENLKDIDEVNLLTNINKLKIELLQLENIINPNIDQLNTFSRLNKLNDLYSTYWSEDILTTDLNQVKQTLDNYRIWEDTRVRYVESISSCQTEHNKLNNGIGLACPNCNTPLLIGDTGVLSASLLEQKLISLQNEFKQHLADGEKYSQVSGLVDLYDRCKALYQHLKNEWDGGIKKLPEKITELRLRYQTSLDWEKKQKLEHELLKLNNLWLMIKDKPSYDEQRLIVLQNAYAACFDKLHLNKQRLNILITIKELNLNYIKTKESIIKINKEQLDLNNELIKCLNDINILNQLSLVNKNILEVNTILTQHSSSEELLNQYKSDINKLTNEQIVINKLMDKLSPIDGELALAMVGNINSVLQEANHILSLTWSYPLEFILYKTEESTELKYQLPMLVNEEHHLMDINEGSSSIKEIGNFALTMALLRHLGLNDLPLYLDEFGRTMDVVHRSEAYRAIYHLYEIGYFSQLIMVSHHSDVYSGVSMGLTVLCDKNIQIPDGQVYNDTTTFD